MQTNATQYIAGNPKFCCDRCGFIRRRNEMRKEWTGFMVCVPCFDPRPPYLDAPNVYPEGLPIQDARPEPADVELVDGNPVTGADL